MMEEQSWEWVESSEKMQGERKLGRQEIERKHCFREEAEGKEIGYKWT